MSLRNGKVTIANPMLLLVSGLCPVLIPSFTLQNGLILGVGVALHAILLAALIPMLIKLVSKNLHFPIAMTASALIAVVYGLAVRMLFPYEYPGLSPFLAFLALNCFGLSVIRGSLRQDSLERFPEYAKSAIGFFVTLAFFSFAREIIGSGIVTLYKSESIRLVLDCRAFVIFPFRIALLPAGAFLLLGYAIAAYRLRIDTKGSRKA